MTGSAQPTPYPFATTAWLLPISRSEAPRAQSSQCRCSAAAEPADLLHRASAVRARARWPSTLCMPRGNGGTSKACRALPGSSWARCPSRNVDLISGLSPAISISQKTGGQSPRSTVGTITEIYDYLRILYARVGKGHCPQCGRPITAQSREQIIERLMAMPAGTRVLGAGSGGARPEGRTPRPVRRTAKAGICPARVDGRVVHFADELRLDRQMRHNIEVVIDRLEIGPKVRPRLAEAVELALKMGEGNLMSPSRSKRVDTPPQKAQRPEGCETSSKRPGLIGGEFRHPLPIPHPTSRCPPITPARTAI